MYKRILVPLDNSLSSDVVVRWALAFAKTLSAEVTFFHVVEWPVPAAYGLPGSTSYLGTLHKDLKATGHDVLEAAKVRAAEAGVSCDAYLRESEHPAEAILHAETSHDLTVMATHSRRGLDRLFLGSVTEAVLRRSDKPHLVLHHSEDAHSEASAPLRRLLLPVDGSACSDRALDEGLRLARALGAAVTIFHAVELPVTVYTMPESMVYDPHIYEELNKFGRDLLEKAAERAKAEGVEADTVLAEGGSVRADQAILDAEAATDLTVIGTHGRRGFNRLLLGSVTERVLRRSDSPHLVIKTPDEG